MTKARDIASAAPAPSTVSATELGYLDGVSSAVQTQLDAKTAKSTLSTTGDIYYASSANTPARLGIGSTGNVLTVASGIPSWAAPATGSSFVGVCCKASADQTGVANATYTAITWDLEDFDTNGFHSNITNNSRITIPSGKAGYYKVYAWIQLNNNTSGARSIQIYKNGSLWHTAATQPGSQYPTMQVSATMNLAVGDYIETYVYQSSGGTLDFYKINPAGTAGFDAYFIGA